MLNLSLRMEFYRAGKQQIILKMQKLNFCFTDLLTTRHPSPPRHGLNVSLLLD